MTWCAAPRERRHGADAVQDGHDPDAVPWPSAYLGLVQCQWYMVCFKLGVSHLRAAHRTCVRPRPRHAPCGAKAWRAAGAFMRLHTRMHNIMHGAWCLRVIEKTQVPGRSLLTLNHIRKSSYPSTQVPGTDEVNVSSFLTQKYSIFHIHCIIHTSGK